ncbi:Transient receptor putative cation channel subfamily A member 1 [Polyrhizophydium stewartii]|uniref:Transient receptor putative cation channel subfamily A member 1 n=1 Tax=Polyrhizophydium stewartii TaxID=2732419 RepID=A0ABR4MYL5_9FUNG
MHSLWGGGRRVDGDASDAPAHPRTAAEQARRSPLASGASLPRSAGSSSPSSPTSPQAQRPTRLGSSLFGGISSPSLRDPPASDAAATTPRTAADAVRHARLGTDTDVRSISSEASGTGSTAPAAPSAKATSGGLFSPTKSTESLGPALATVSPVRRSLFNLNIGARRYSHQQLPPESTSGIRGASHAVNSSSISIASSTTSSHAPAAPTSATVVLPMSPSPGTSGTTPMSAATPEIWSQSMSGRRDFTTIARDELLRSTPVDVRKLNSLQRAVFNGNKKALVELLQQRKRSVDKRDSVHRVTALQLAAELGKTDMARFLLGMQGNTSGKRADPNLADDEGRSPLILAAAHGHGSTIKALLGAGALIDHRDNLGCTALHYAVAANSLEALDMLLSHGANMDFVDRSGDSLLHHAIRFGHREIAQRLIKRGHSPTIQNTTQMTPMHFAAKRGLAPIVISLFQRGADPTAVDGSGRTPLEYVPDEFEDVADILKQQATAFAQRQKRQADTTKTTPTRGTSPTPSSPNPRTAALSPMSGKPDLPSSPRNSTGGATQGADRFSRSSTSDNSRSNDSDPNSFDDDDECEGNQSKVPDVVEPSTAETNTESLAPAVVLRTPGSATVQKTQTAEGNGRASPSGERSLIETISHRRRSTSSLNSRRSSLSGPDEIHRARSNSQRMSYTSAKASADPHHTIKESDEEHDGRANTEFRRRESSNNLKIGVLSTALKSRSSSPAINARSTSSVSLFGQPNIARAGSPASPRRKESEMRKATSSSSIGRSDGSDPLDFGTEDNVDSMLFSGQASPAVRSNKSPEPTRSRRQSSLRNLSPSPDAQRRASLSPTTADKTPETKKPDGPAHTRPPGLTINRNAFASDEPLVPLTATARSASTNLPTMPNALSSSISSVIRGLGAAFSNSSVIDTVQKTIGLAPAVSASAVLPFDGGKAGFNQDDARTPRRPSMASQSDDMLSHSASRLRGQPLSIDVTPGQMPRAQSEMQRSGSTPIMESARHASDGDGWMERVHPQRSTTPARITIPRAISHQGSQASVSSSQAILASPARNIDVTLITDQLERIATRVPDDSELVPILSALSSVANSLREAQTWPSAATQRVRQGVEAQVESMAKELADLRTELGRSRDACATLEQECTLQRKIIAKRDGQIQALNQQLKTAIESESEPSRESCSRCSRMDDSAKLAVSPEVIKFYENEVRLLSQQIDEERRLRGIQESDQERLLQRIGELEGRLAQLQATPGPASDGAGGQELPDEYEKLLVSSRDACAALQRELDAANARIASLEVEMQECDRQMLALDDELQAQEKHYADLESDHNALKQSSLAETERQRQTEAKHAAELSKERARATDLEGKLAELTACAEAAREEIVALQSQLEAHASAADERSDALADLTAKHRTEIEKLERAHAEQIKGQESRIDEEIALRVQKQVASDVAAVEQRHADELSKERRKHAAELVALQRRHRAEIDEVAVKHSAEVDALAKDHAAQMHSAAERHADEVCKIAEKHAVETEELRRALLEKSEEADKAEPIEVLRKISEPRLALSRSTESLNIAEGRASAASHVSSLQAPFSQIHGLLHQIKELGAQLEEAYGELEKVRKERDGLSRDLRQAKRGTSSDIEWMQETLDKQESSLSHHIRLLQTMISNALADAANARQPPSNRPSAARKSTGDHDSSPIQIALQPFSLAIEAGINELDYAAQLFSLLMERHATVNGDLQSRIDALSVEAEALRDKANQLGEMHAAAESRVKFAHDELEDFKVQSARQVDALRKQIDKHEQHVSDLQRKLEKSQESVGRLESEMAEQAMESNNCIVDLRQAVAGAQQDLASERAEHEQSRLALAEARGQLETKTASFKNECGLLEAQITDKGRQLAAALASLDSMGVAQTERDRMYRQQLEAAQHELTEQIAQCTELKRRLDRLVALQAAWEQDKADLVELQAANVALERRVVALEASSTVDSARMTESLALAQSEAELSRQDVDRLRAETASLRESARAKDAQIQELLGQVERLDGTKAALERQLHVAGEQARTAEDRSKAIRAAAANTIEMLESITFTVSESISVWTSTLKTRHVPKNVLLDVKDTSPENVTVALSRGKSLWGKALHDLAERLADLVTDCEANISSVDVLSVETSKSDLTMEPALLEAARTMLATQRECFTQTRDLALGISKFAQDVAQLLGVHTDGVRELMQASLARSSEQAAKASADLEKRLAAAESALAQAKKTEPAAPVITVSHPDASGSRRPNVPSKLSIDTSAFHVCSEPDVDRDRISDIESISPGDTVTAQFRERLEAMEKTVADYEETIKEQKHTLAEMEELNTNLELKMSPLSEEVANANLRILELQSQIEKLAREKQEQAADFARLQAGMNAGLAPMQLVRDKLASPTIATGNLDASSQQQQLKSELQRAQQQLAETTTRLEEMQCELQSKAAQMQRMKVQLRDAQEKHEAESQELRDRNSSLNADIKRLSDSCSRAADQASQARRTAGELETQLEEARQTHAGLKAEIKRLQQLKRSQADELQLQIDEERQRANDLQQRLAAESREAVRRAESARSEAADLQKSLDTERDAANQLRQRVANEAREAARRLDDAQREHASRTAQLEEHIQKLESDADVLRDRVSELQRQSQALEAKLRSKESSIQQLGHELAALRDEKMQSESAESTMLTQIHKLSAERNRLVKDLQAQGRQVVLLTERIASLEQDLAGAVAATAATAAPSIPASVRPSSPVHSADPALMAQLRPGSMAADASLQIALARVKSTESQLRDERGRRQALEAESRSLIQEYEAALEQFRVEQRRLEDELSALRAGLRGAERRAEACSTRDGQGAKRIAELESIVKQLRASARAAEQRHADQERRLKEDFDRRVIKAVKRIDSHAGTRAEVETCRFRSEKSLRRAYEQQITAMRDEIACLRRELARSS